MTQTPDGWVPSSDVSEATLLWTAEVSTDSVSLYAKPDAQGDVLRTAEQGDLVRVAGVSPGIDGDSNLWWATTDGYADLHEYSTFIKYRADRMTSTTVPTAEHSYDLPNVPFTQYFKSDGSAIHGTYWHDEFGTVQSQGCINVTWTDSEYLFGQTTPQIPPDQIGLPVAPEQATPVVIVN